MLGKLSECPFALGQAAVVDCLAVDARGRAIEMRSVDVLDVRSELLFKEVFVKQVEARFFEECVVFRLHILISNRACSLQ